MSITVTDLRKSDNGIATGFEAYITRDGISAWLDENEWDAQVMDAVFMWRHSLSSSRSKRQKKRPAECLARRNPTSVISKEPRTVAEGPQRGDSIEVCFPGPKRKWHRGVVTHDPYAAPSGRLIYTVHYSNGRVFVDHLSLPWRLYSRPEPRDPLSGPSVDERIEVAWPSEIIGRAKGSCWIAGKVLAVESVASDRGSFMRYTIWYPETGSTFCDRLSFPWRPARTKASRRVCPRTVEKDAPLLLERRLEDEVVTSQPNIFDLNDSDTDCDDE